jgi:hypothetical protein
MLGSIRRVHKLRVTGIDETTLGGAVNALQDAFRVASLPGLPPHGLLLIRKLDLGRLQARASSLALSNLIDERMRTLASTALCVDQIEQPQQDLVWFSDPAQAAICLAEMVAARRAPSAWYWQTLFPSWRPGMQLAETLPAVAHDCSELPASNAIMARVIRHLLERQQTSQVLGALSPQLARQQLAEAGIFPHSLSHSHHQPEPTDLEPGWDEPLHGACRQWGANDARTLWLCYCALILDNPALSEHPRLLSRMTATIAALANASEIQPTELQTREDATRLAAPPRPEEKSASSIDTLSSTLPMEGVAEDRFESNGSHPQASDAFRQADFDGATSNGSIQDDARRRALNNAADTTTTAAMRAQGLGANQPSVEATNNRESQQLTADRTRQHDDNDSRAESGGFTLWRHAGLAYVLSLFELLSIRELLSINPLLAELHLPTHTLRALGHRYGVPPDHPVLASLPNAKLSNKQKIRHFVCPQSWCSLLHSRNAHAPALRRYTLAKTRSSCVITDYSGRLVLYVGADNPVDLPEWVANARVLAPAGDCEYPTLADLSITLQLMMSRYLLRYSGMNLRQVIHRSGKIAATQTHLDILFRARQMDIRIRRCGIDINPGWITWIARVVEFHYDQGDPVDG